MYRALAVSWVLVAALAGTSVALAQTAGSAATTAHTGSAATTAHSGTAGRSRVMATTAYIEDMAVAGTAAWTATRGGVEHYDVTTRQRVRVYTTLDGLPETHVLAVQVAGGVVRVRTREHECTLIGQSFACARSAPAAAPEPSLAPMAHGARVSARKATAHGELVATAGAGLWLHGPGAEPARLTPEHQVCSNHITAMAEHQGRLYLGSFDEGLCLAEVTKHGISFRRLTTPFRMVNDLIATPAGIYVAANAGLFHAPDGERFRQITYVTERGVNGLAFDGRTLYATSPGTLWRIRVRGGPRSRQWWKPGGATAVQKVSVGPDGTVWMASEDRGVIRFDGNKTFALLDRANGLPESWVMDVESHGHTVYAALFRRGLVAIDTAELTTSGPTIRPIAGLPDSWLLSVSKLGNGELWVGTQGGAAHIDASGTVTATIDDLPHPCVHAILEFAGYTWLGTEGGLLLIPAPSRPSASG